MKTINREELIKCVANLVNDRHLDYYAVKEVFEKFDWAIVCLLTSRWDSNVKEDMKIRISEGLSIERKYVPHKTQGKGILANKEIPEHYNIKAKISESFLKKVNNYAKDIF